MLAGETMDGLTLLEPAETQAERSQAAEGGEAEAGQRRRVPLQKLRQVSAAPAEEDGRGKRSGGGHPGLAGLELWNYLRDWAQSFRFWQPASYRLEEVAGRIKGPPQWLLARWDREAARRPFPAICGSDNHAKRPPLATVTFFPHDALIGRLVCRVRLERPLPADGPAAVKQLFAALGAGRSLVAREELGSSAGFDFRVEAADGRALRPGEGAAALAGARAVVESPREAELAIVAGGRPVASGQGRRLEAPLDAAAPVRAEARLDGKAWVFTNHVRAEGPAPR